MTQTVIFDIDGTIADLEHRRGFVRTKPKNWKAFNEGMINDTPIKPTIELLKALYGAGWTIIMASGRGSEYREVTKKWLEDHGVQYHKLYMRPKRDYRRDDEIKSELYDQMLADGFEPLFVVDDRLQVCRMWYKRGLFVLNVNQTLEEF